MKVFNDGGWAAEEAAEVRRMKSSKLKAIEKAGITSADSHLLIGGRCDRGSTRRTAATNESRYRDLSSQAS